MTSDTTPASAPALSSIILTPDDYGVIAKTVRHLRAQSIASRIELLIVAPRADQVHMPPEVQASFHSVRFVETGTFESFAAARAAGVAAASAPYVAFNEDHSFPDPGWAEALLDAHRRGYTGVAPRMENANPQSALSWAAMLLHFGGVLESEYGFETPHPAASHNMSYSRAALLDMGDRLSELLLAELFLHDALRANGHRFWVEPAAQTRHVNISLIGPALVHAWLGGRMYGGLRPMFGSWPAFRRIIYAAGSPVIPLLRLSRVIPEIRRKRVGRRLLPRLLAPIAIILVVHAAGEAAGYLFGLGQTRISYSEKETRRDRYVRPEERKLWE